MTTEGGSQESPEAESQESPYLFDKPGMHEYRGVLYLSFMPPSLLEQLQELPMYAEDVLFGTYPRSGTPMLSEIMWLLHNNADVTAARGTRHGVRVRFLDHFSGSHNPIQNLSSQLPPRLIKTHLPATFYTKQLMESPTPPKTVIMIRNPKDMLVSFFKFYTADTGYVRFPGDWNQFFELFKSRQLFGGDWFDHTLSWWRLRHLDNVLIVHYEDIRAEPERNIIKMAEFIGVDVNEDHVDKIKSYIIQEMPEESPIGGWKDYFTVHQNRLFNQMFCNKMKACDLQFDNM